MKPVEKTMCKSDISLKFAFESLETKGSNKSLKLAVSLGDEENSCHAQFRSLLKIYEPDRIERKAFFILLAFGVTFLNFSAIQGTIDSILEDNQSAMSYSNYFVILCVGMDLMYSFSYLTLAYALDAVFYRFCLLLALLYFLMFAASDLRVFHLVSRIYLSTASANDVGLVKLDEPAVQEARPRIQLQALLGSVLVHLLPRRQLPILRLLLLLRGTAHLPNRPQPAVRSPVPPRPVQPLLRPASEDLSICRGR